MKTGPIDLRAVKLHAFALGLAGVERRRVDSSAVASVGYDAARRVLEVEYRGGGAYAYAGVPPRTYAALLAASSKGAFVNARVKGRYPFRRR